MLCKLEPCLDCVALVHSIAVVWGAPRRQGLHSTSALLWAPEKAGVRQPLLIFSPCLGTPENAGVT